jgi:hypothetical protein
LLSSIIQNFIEGRSTDRAFCFDLLNGFTLFLHDQDFVLDS